MLLAVMRRRAVAVTASTRGEGTPRRERRERGHGDVSSRALCWTV
jgi:hypothetical protein